MLSRVKYMAAMAASALLLSGCLATIDDLDIPSTGAVTPFETVSYEQRNRTTGALMVFKWNRTDAGYAADFFDKGAAETRTRDAFHGSLFQIDETMFAYAKRGGFGLGHVAFLAIEADAGPVLFDTCAKDHDGFIALARRHNVWDADRGACAFQSWADVERFGAAFAAADDLRQDLLAAGQASELLNLVARR